MSGGTTSIQAWKEEKLQANPASLCTTLWPCLRVWQKTKLLKVEEAFLMLLMICPKLVKEKSSLFKALITISESPSTITWSKLSSLAKQRPPHATNTFTISTEVGSGITCVKVAITRPWSFRIIAPRPAELFSLKSAPSILIFNQFFGGGVRLMEFGIGGGGGWSRSSEGWMLVFLQIFQSHRVNHIN